VRDDKRPRIDETLAPLRNFSITAADQIRAAAGPPAFMRRKRHIEDLTDSLRECAASAIARTGGDAVAARAVLESQAAVVRSLRELNRLIASHNRYYPIEANLPIDPVTRVQLDRGAPRRPWRPLPAVTLCDVVDGALSACGAAATVGKML